MDDRHGKTSLTRTVGHLLHLRVRRSLAEAGDFPCMRCGQPIDYRARNPHPASVVLVPATSHGDVRGPVLPAHHECSTDAERQA
jgi:hypothetical protein